MGTVLLLGAFEESNRIAWVNIRPGDAVVHFFFLLLCCAHHDDGDSLG